MTGLKGDRAVMRMVGFTMGMLALAVGLVAF